VHLLIFDIDGTLTSFAGITGKAFNDTFEELYHQPGPWGRVPPHGRTDRVILRECFAAVGVDGDLDENFRAFIAPYLRNLQEALRTATGAHLMLGVRELMERLNGNPSAHLALGTGNIERAARMKLEHLGLNDFFPVGGFGDNAEHRVTVIEEAIRNAERHYECPFVAETTWVIGDTTYDIEAGKVLRLRTLGVATGGLHSIEDLAKAQPNLLLESLADTDFVVRSIGL
jgi:phosphoglycolate phosphatase